MQVNIQTNAGNLDFSCSDTVWKGILAGLGVYKIPHHWEAE